MGGVRQEKMKNLRFMRRRIDAPSQAFTKEEKHRQLSVLYA